MFLQMADVASDVLMKDAGVVKTALFDVMNMFHENAAMQLMYVEKLLISKITLDVVACFSLLGVFSAYKTVSCFHQKELRLKSSLFILTHFCALSSNTTLTLSYSALFWSS